MKPESIKSILKSYLRERQYSSTYDDIDGFDNPERMAGEPFDPMEGRPNDFVFAQPHHAGLPLEELNAPLLPEEEKLARDFGRQLSQMSDDFEMDHTGAARSQAPANGSRSVEFEKHIIYVPPTCDHIQIPIIRKKAADDKVNVTWRTCDKSAKAGLHYVKNRGTISFAQGDEKKTIDVQIIRDMDRRNDIHFAVELYDDEGTFNTLMIYIHDDSQLYPEEKQVVENILNCGRNISISEIMTCLSDNVTRNTFKVALQCLSSSADSVPKEFALGAELLRLTAPYARFSLLTNVFCEFFSYLPELEELAPMF